ncbi:MAG: alpha-mannosidase, partial [Microcystaceae cyanobacterium]
QPAKPGETIHLALRLVSPGHDIGGLMRSRLIYERDYPELDPGFIADEWEVLAKYLTAFEPEKLPDLTNLLASIPWEIVGDRPAFDQHLIKLRETLKPLTKSLKKRKFYLLGHAHLDMAWLWPLAETWEAGERTFRSVLNLQQEFPELTFGHTSPLLYAWIEEHKPALFQQIQQAVKNHHWELLGGMWIEPDVNLIAGESIARQLLYGQRYFQEKFQQISKVAWLPDSFGFCFQLPQLLSQAGIEYFVTGKLHWNDTTKFPPGAFWWESPDGTRLMTVLSPPNVAGVMDTNPITMANYGVQWEQQTGLQDIFWLPGVGDHGGGPTRDMLTVKQRWQASDFFPEIISTTALNYLEKVKKTLLQQPELIPVWQADLYLELHRGYYTTHADQKRANRQAEKSLYTAELWSSIASLVDHFPYPQSELETAWKKTLLNQFHDILPGTSIPEVFTEANQDWQAVHSLTENLIQQALTAITGQVNTGQPPVKDAQPLMLFHALNGSRSEVVILSLGAGKVYNTKGQEILTQKTFDGQCCFLAENIPSIGYQLYWFVPQGQDLTQSVIIEPIAETILENDDVRGVIDPQTGDIASFYDKHQQREIFRQPGNQLQFFTDQGQYWDAW